MTTLPSSISRTTGPLRVTPNGVEGVPSHAVPWLTTRLWLRWPVRKRKPCSTAWSTTMLGNKAQRSYTIVVLNHKLQRRHFTSQQWWKILEDKSLKEILAGIDKALSPNLKFESPPLQFQANRISPPSMNLDSYRGENGESGSPLYWSWYASDLQNDSKQV